MLDLKIIDKDKTLFLNANSLSCKLNRNPISLLSIFHRISINTSFNVTKNKKLSYLKDLNVQDKNFKIL